jgi:hypothetical protein
LINHGVLLSNGIDAVIHIASLHAPHLAIQSAQAFIDVFARVPEGAAQTDPVLKTLDRLLEDDQL